MNEHTSADWQLFKHLVERWGGRCLIVEDGRPRYVLMTVEEYFAAAPAAVREALTDDELMERINRDMEALKARERERAPQVEFPEEPRPPAVVSLDDLPIGEQP